MQYVRVAGRGSNIDQARRGGTDDSPSATAVTAGLKHARVCAIKHLRIGTAHFHHLEINRTINTI